MKTTKDKNHGSYIVVAFLSYSVAVLPVSAGCYKNGEGDPCFKTGDIIDTGESLCANLTGEGPILVFDYWHTVAENPALSTAVREIDALDLWGIRNVVAALTYTEVSVTLIMPDPDDCSQTITIPGYATDVLSCSGTITDFQPICYN